LVVAGITRTTSIASHALPLTSGEAGVGEGLTVHSADGAVQCEADAALLVVVRARAFAIAVYSLWKGRPKDKIGVYNAHIICLINL